MWTGDAAVMANFRQICDHDMNTHHKISVTVQSEFWKRTFPMGLRIKSQMDILKKNLIGEKCYSTISMEKCFLHVEIEGIFT